MFKKNKKKNIDTDIFFNVKSNQKFDDLMERPLEKSVFLTYIFFIFFVVLIFVWRLYYYQVLNYEKYKKFSENNYIKSEVLFSDRGIVLDRNGKELVWNEGVDGDDKFGKRKYLTGVGLSHILGFLSYPKKDKSGNFYIKEYVGKAGVEKHFNEYLNGKLGKKILKVDAHHNILSQNSVIEPEVGKNLKLTIDLDLQKILYKALKRYVEAGDFVGGAGIIMNVQNGEILASVSLPEYDSNLMTEKNDKKKIKKYFKDKRNIFLNRVFLGGYTPGSIVKPFVGMMALENNIVKPNTSFYTTGRLILPNKWNPSRPTIFADWKNHGMVNLYKAIAQSSDVYFYIIGGGLHNILHYSDREGLGIDRLVNGFNNFSFGQRTGLERFKEKAGLVPNKEWKKKVFNRDWNVGNTYFTSIGQFGFLVTPLQAAVATAAIANGGKLIKPRISELSKVEIKRNLNYSEDNFKVIREAMRYTVLMGTTKALNLDFVKVATKSGTAQVKNNTKNNAWVEGFWPYEKPKYVFVILGDEGPIEHKSASVVMREVFLKMKENGLEKYFK